MIRGLFLLMAVSGCVSLPRYPVSDHFDGKHFFLPGGPQPKGFGSVIKWQFTKEKAEWPDWVENSHHPRLPEGEVGDGETFVTFIGHATCLVQLRGLTVLTDPFFSDRASPFSWAGPKRVRRPGIELEDLPLIDVVVLGHNHYDHFDVAAAKRLWLKQKPIFVVPLGNAKLLQAEGIERVIELDWWQRYEVEQGRGITLVPSQHWSARTPFDRNEALWGSFVIESDETRVFFAGDTGYGPHFKQVRQRLGPMNVSLLPIGAYEPRWFMKDQHMDPSDAVRAHLDLESKASMGIHFATLQLTDEGLYAPQMELAKVLETQSLPTDAFKAPGVGETLRFNR